MTKPKIQIQSVVQMEEPTDEVKIILLERKIAESMEAYSIIPYRIATQKKIDAQNPQVGALEGQLQKITVSLGLLMRRRDKIKGSPEKTYSSSDMNVSDETLLRLLNMEASIWSNTYYSAQIDLEVAKEVGTPLEEAGKQLKNSLKAFNFIKSEIARLEKK
jgi:hypothetical protein